MDFLATDDIHQTLRYGHQQIRKLRLGLALPALCLGLAGLVFDLGDDRVGYPTRGLLIVGGLWTAYELIRLAFPGKPILVLSPDGIVFNIEFVRQLLIPWREVHAVDTIDFRMSYPFGNFPFSLFPLPIWYRGVTAILLSKSFYDRVIHTDSVFQRGLYWNNTFLSRGDMVQMVLHHDILPVKGPELRAAVEARWKAFRDQPPASVPRSGAVAATAQGALVKPTQPIWWARVTITASIVGIAVILANAAGLWETPTQRTDRIARQKWADELRQIDEETRQREKRIDDLMKQVDRPPRF